MPCLVAGGRIGKDVVLVATGRAALGGSLGIKLATTDAVTKPVATAGCRALVGADRVRVRRVGRQVGASAGRAGERTAAARAVAFAFAAHPIDTISGVAVAGTLAGLAGLLFTAARANPAAA